MKKTMTIRSLISLLMAAVLLALCCAPALADSGKVNLHQVTLDISLRDNMILAKYGVRVTVDGREIATLSQGSHCIKILSLDNGVHTLTLHPLMADVSPMSMDFCAADNLTIAMTAQTHVNYVGVNSCTANLPGQVITNSEDRGNGKDWTQFVLEMLAFLSLEG